MAEAIPNFSELRQGVCNRQRRRLQYTGFVKGVVPSDADCQVSSITGQPAQLTAYLTDYGAIPGEQCGLTALRQHFFQLAQNVGISANIGGVVENGIAKQNDVYHCAALRITSFRP